MIEAAGNPSKLPAQLALTNCENGWQTKVLFECSDSSSDELIAEVIRFGEVQDKSCLLTLSVGTELACADPMSLVECIAVSDSGVVYDLSSLAKIGQNWIAHDGEMLPMSPAAS